MDNTQQQKHRNTQCYGQIPQCKWQNKKPSLNGLKIELKSLLELLKDSCEDAALICENVTQFLSL